MGPMRVSDLPSSKSPEPIFQLLCVVHTSAIACVVWCVYYKYMPRYNVWIRDEDNKKWLGISNRSEWLHNKLRSSTPELKKPSKPSVVSTKTLDDIQVAEESSNWSGPMYRNDKKGKL